MLACEYWGRCEGVELTPLTSVEPEHVESSWSNLLRALAVYTVQESSAKMSTTPPTSQTSTPTISTAGGGDPRVANAASNLVTLSTLISNAVQTAMNTNMAAIDTRIQAGIQSHFVSTAPSGPATQAPLQGSGGMYLSPWAAQTGAMAYAPTSVPTAGHMPPGYPPAASPWTPHHVGTPPMPGAMAPPLGHAAITAPLAGGDPSLSVQYIELKLGSHSGHAKTNLSGHCVKMSGHYFLKVTPILKYMIWYNVANKNSESEPIQSSHINMSSKKSSSESLVEL